MNRVIAHLAAGLLLALASTGRAATIQPIDGQSFEAAIRGVEGKLLVVAPAKSADKPDKIPLEILHRIVWAPITPPASPVAATPTTADASSSSSVAVRRPRLIRRGGPVESDNSDTPQEGPKPPKTKTLPVQWQLELVGGDRVRGEPIQWILGKITMRPAAGSVGAGEFNAPESHIAALWRSDADLIHEASAKIAALAAAEGDDVLVVMKDDQLQAVAGKLIEIAKSSVKFRFMDQERSLDLARMVGVVLAAKNRVQPAAGDRHRIRLKTGDGFTGSIASCGDTELTIRAAWGDVVRFNISSVSSVEICGSRVTYLSDLRPADVEQVPYFDRIVPMCIDRAPGGGPLVLADGVYDKGIAVHSRTVLQYDLGGRFAVFRARAGFQQPQGRAGRAVIRVIADGKPLFENLDARGDGSPIPLDLSVTGVRRLTLEVDFGVEQDVADRVVWADARLITAKPAAPTPVPEPK